MAQEDLTAALQEISASISTSLRDGVRQIADEVGQLKQQAAASNQQVEKIVRDLYTAISTQNKSQASVQQSIDREEKTEVKAEAVAERTYTLEQQQLQSLAAINTTLGNLTKALRQGFADLNSSQQSLTQTITDSKTSFTNPLSGIGGAYAEGGLYQAGGFALGRGIKALGSAAIANAGGLAVAAELNNDNLGGIPKNLQQQLRARLGIPESDAPKAQGTGISPVGSSGFSGDGGGKNVKISGSASEAISYFQSKGWSKEQAVGLAANLQVESKFKTDAIGDSGTAYGIAQWHPDRQREFERVMGIPIRQSNFKQQLEFVNYELTQGNEKGAGNKIRNAGSAAEAAALVDQYYERSSGAHRGQRVQIAQQLAGASASAQLASGGGGGGDATPVASGAVVAQDRSGTNSSQDAVRQNPAGGTTGAGGAPGADSGPSQQGAQGAGGREYASLQGGSAHGHGIISGLPSNQDAGHGGGVDKSGGNGKLDPSSLQSLGEGNHKLQPAAAEAYKRMKEAAQKDGVTWSITDSYRDYATQVRLAQQKGLYSQGGLAATPGKSNHGWGLALDLGGGANQAGSKQNQWLQQNAGRFGFSNIPREPWHWQYGGGDSSRVVAQDNQATSGSTDTQRTENQQPISSGSTPTNIGPATAAGIGGGGFGGLGALAGVGGFGGAGALLGLLGGLGGGGGGLGGGALGTYGVEAFQASGVGPRSGIPSSALTSSLATGAPLGIGGGVPGGASGLLGQLIPNITGAGQNAQIEEFSNRSAMNEAKQLKMQEQLNGILSQQQQQAAAQYADTNWPQKGTDYNNASDISFGPAWPEIVGQAYPEYGDKVRLNPFKRR